MVSLQAEVEPGGAVAAAAERPGPQPVRMVLRGRRRQLLGAAALLTGHQLGEAGVPVVIGFAIDDAIAKPALGLLLLWLLALAVDFVLLSLCWRFGSRLGAAARFGIAHDLREAVVTRVLDGRGIAAGATRNGGELLTIAVSDARHVGDAVRVALAGAAGMALLVTALVAVATVSPLLAVVVIAGAAVTLVAVAVMSHPVEARSHAEQEANAGAAALAVDLVAGLRVLVGLRAGAAAAARYRVASHDAVRSSIRAAEAQALVTGIAALAVGGYLTAVAGVSAELALDGRVSVGTVIAVLGLSQLLLGPLQTVAQAVPAIRRGRASAARITALVTAPAVLGDGGEAGVEEDGAELAGGDLVVAALDGAGLEALELHVRAGTLHGVACDSPLAAESLVAALAGEAAMPAGRVLLGGVDLATMSPHARRAALLVWSHGSIPPGATVAELVGLGAHGPAAAQAAVAAAAAEDVIERLPDGWDAPLIAHGAGLSGGERQRLALARVLAERPPALVLHEPSSAVDAVTELQVAAGIRRARQGLTTVLVTTSATLLAACDAVSLIAEEGAVEARTHAELLEHEPYRELIGR